MTFAEVAALVIFCVVIVLTLVLVLVPVAIRLPPCKGFNGVSVQLSYAYVPVCGVLVMLATGSLTGHTLAQGILGDSNLKPYGIVILFMALAYMSTSLDMTGCFAWLALHITKVSKGNGLVLFLLYFGLSSLITIFTSNDICIMTLTPIIYYFAVATSTDPIPFLAAEFTAANIWSMLLFVGNPTNLIVALAYQLSFAEYSKWMALPTLGAGLSCFAVLYAIHVRNIPKRLSLPELQPSFMLVDKPGAVFGTVNLLLCLGLLAAAPSLRWELWAVTLVCATLHALYNLVAYVLFKGWWCKVPPTVVSAEQQTAGQCGSTDAVAVIGNDPTGHEVLHPSKDLEPDHAVTDAAVCWVPMSNAGEVHLELPTSSLGGQQQQQPQPQQDPEMQQGCSHVQPVQQLQCHVMPRQECAAAMSECDLLCEQFTALSGSQHPSDGKGLPGSSLQDSTARSLPVRPAATESGGNVGSKGCQGPGKARQRRQHNSDGSSLHHLSGVQHQSSIQQAAFNQSCSRSGGGNDVAIIGPRSQCPSLLQQQCSMQASPVPGAVLLQVTQPDFWRILQVLPWDTVPFVLGMFILVEGLNANGWVNKLALWLAGGINGSVWTALLVIGFFSVMLGNLCNNQPMTILMTRVCMSHVFVQAASSAATTSSKVPLAAAFAVVIASNVAANYTVMGALAGIMWINILKRQGVKGVGYVLFSKLMLPAGVVSTVVALVVLGAELVMW